MRKRQKGFMRIPRARGINSGPPGTDNFDGIAEKPRVYVDTTIVDTIGAPSSVKTTWAQVQTAINAADNTAGPVFIWVDHTLSGSATLNFPQPPGSRWIYLITDAYSSIPAKGTRVGPGNASNMPTLIATSSLPVRAITTSVRANHYRVIGFNIKASVSTFSTGLVVWGGGLSNMNDIPTDLILDRCIIAGDPTLGARRGLAMNGIRCAVDDCYMPDYKEVGQDAQAICAWDTPGPLRMSNNYLEGAGENIMLGGGEPTITNMTPEDIHIFGNYLFKPLSLNGSAYTVKNLFESKHARRLLFERNSLKNIWAAGQAGYVYNIKSSGTSSWTQTQDCIVRDNVGRNAECGLTFSAVDTGAEIGASRLRFRNNFTEVTRPNAGDGRLLMLLNNLSNPEIEACTFIINTTGGQGGFIGYDENPTPAIKIPGAKIRNSIFDAGDTDIDGVSAAPGNPTFDRNFAAPYDVSFNSIIGSSATYDASNNKPANQAAAYTNVAGGDFTAKSGGPCYRNASDGVSDRGANITLIFGYAAAAEAGTAGTSGGLPA